MKVILVSEVKGKGGEGDVVEVAQGYAENYLFPKKMALPATPGNLKQLEERRHKIAEREVTRIKDAEALRDMIDGKVVMVDVKIGEEGQLFGSVTNAMVADELKKQCNVDIDRKRIEISRPIKTAGLHEVVVSLYRDIFATLEVQVGNPNELPEGDNKVPDSEEIVPTENSEPSDDTSKAEQEPDSEQAVQDEAATQENNEE